MRQFACFCQTHTVNCLLVGLGQVSTLLASLDNCICFPPPPLDRKNVLNGSLLSHIQIVFTKEKWTAFPCYQILPKFKSTQIATCGNVPVFKIQKNLIPKIYQTLDFAFLTPVFGCSCIFQISLVPNTRTLHVENGNKHIHGFSMYILILHHVESIS